MSKERATVVIVTLMLLCIVSMGFGVYQLINGNKGSPCAVEVKYANSKATYVGYSL